MSKKDIANVLAILDAIDQIKKYTENVIDADAFYQNRIVFDATLMNFVLIGEMTERLSDELKNKATHIEWQKIKGFRNMIAHDYLGIDAEEVWQIIADDLYPFRTDVQKIINKLQQDR